MNLRTCFVISPIGEKGTEIRENADAVFKLLIEPALVSFREFKVVRADQIPGSRSINQDVIQLVQESDLCIVDLTGWNPNVFYECGRRHETGKPAILIIKKGEDAPFNLRGIRTIAYDLSTAWSANESVEEIRKFVQELAGSGFKESSSGATLADIKEMLVRIERKVGGGGGTVSGGVPVQGRGSGLSALVQNPQVALHQALMNGDIQSVVSVLPRLEKLLGYTEAVITAAGVAAINGEEAAVDLLFRALEADKTKTTVEERVVAITAIVQFFIATDRESEGASRLAPIAAEIDQDPDFSAESRSRVWNQLQMIQYGAEDYDSALQSSDKTVSLFSDEPAYWYNRSLVLEKLERFDLAVAAIKECVKLGGSEDSHHAQAYELLYRAGNHPEAQRELEKLREKNETLAAVVESRVLSAENEPRAIERGAE